MNIKKQYNEIGNKYICNKEDFFSKEKDKTIKFIETSLPFAKGQTILDIGCGHGPGIKLLELKGFTDIYGLDASEFMVNEAKKNVSKPENIILAEIETTTFKDEMFDVVVGRFSFNYLESIDKAYEEMSRILKKNGLLIIITHHPFKDLFCQKNKVYGVQEIIKIELFHNKTQIQFPTHTMLDYFSETFFKHFNLCGYTEDWSPEEGEDDQKIPRILGIKAIKK